MKIALKPFEDASEVDAVIGRSSKDLKWMILTAFIVFLTNIAIYWVEILVRDDYYYGIFRWHHELNATPSLRVEGFMYINRLLCWIAGDISTPLARTLIIFFIMIPASLLLIQILRKLGYPVAVAFFTANFIWLFPNQLQIPYFINGSYMAEAFLIMLAGFWFGLKYLETKARCLFVATLITFYWAQNVSELVVPATVALASYLLVLGKFEKKAWMIVGTLAFVTSYQTYRILEIGREVVKTSQPLSPARIQTILKAVIDWSLPYTHLEVLDNNKSLVVISFGILLILITILINRYSDRHSNRILPNLQYSREFWYRLLFPFLFLLLTSITMSKAPWFSSRHAIFPIFGFSLLLSYSCHLLLDSNKLATRGILFMLLFVSGISHYERVYKEFSLKNQQHSQILSFLKGQNFPQRSQIVVVNTDVTTGGFRKWSTGYLYSILKRRDVTGLVGAERMRANAFTTAYNPGGMTGLNLRDPIFLYRRNGDGVKQLTYFLHWEKDSAHSNYNVYHADPISGNLKVIAHGAGLSEYAALTTDLARQGIYKKDIMWGGDLTPADRKRLSL